MKIQDIFTADELALIDSGNYKPGRAVLDAKLELAIAIEREACAKVCDDEWSNAVERSFGEQCSAIIRGREARGNT